jgi:hypothetical protein
VSLRVARALLAGELVCVAPTSLVSPWPLVPLQVSSLAREVVSDPRDHAVYEDEQEDLAGGDGGASDNHQAQHVVAL